MIRASHSDELSDNSNDASNNSYCNIRYNINETHFCHLVEIIKQKRIPRYDESMQHFAIIVKKGCYNQYNCIIGENKLSNKCKFIKSTHAEIDALNKFINKIDQSDKKKRYDLLVLRLSKTGKLGESRPCYHCLEKLEKSNINIHNVYYSTKDGAIEKEKFNTMKESAKTIYCGGYRQLMREKMKPVNKFVYKN